MDAKRLQLGMNPSTARNRLLKDIVGKLLSEQNASCFRCGKPLNGDWTIDHIENWLHSDDPVSMYFDLENVAFSHHACNSGAHRKNGTRQPHKQKLKKEAARKRKVYCPQKRHRRYIKTGW